MFKQIEERIALNIMMSDITVSWNVSKKNITCGLYLHLINELHGNHNHDFRDKNLVFPCNTTFWKSNICIKDINELTICSNK